ncbi:nuclear transport factor 2 family protein [Yinghuangia sp. ASG 101]|uniref:nuclear transport factor 2 family protein n=1 Tax=Yinghuangia sp. ASG 101 TaxID=2896848 RepID=UPI001E461718|nr:nuclear transport factor 2 family protein [Yinghuangia sp. ASG 101]UGQ11986.1 nuclear transport factor 2 family protein [Yinghuangia sp. ASG 101]
MITDELVAKLWRHWEDGFNQYDVDLVMAPIDEDIVFSSPFVRRRTGDPAKVTVEGFDTFRDYIDDSMRRLPGIRYTIDSVLVSPRTVVFLYGIAFADGQTANGADYLRLNDAGRVVEWRCHYPREFVDARL